MFSSNKSKKLTKLVTFYQTNTIDPLDWTLVLVNKNYLKNTPITREIDIYHDKELIQFKLAKIKANELYQSVLINQINLFDQTIDENAATFVQYINQFMDQFINSKILYFGNKLNEAKVVNPLNLDLEDKSLEWIKVSFKVLKEALINSRRDDSEYTFSFFSGINPNHQMFEWRVIIFNLDIQFILLNDQNLRVKIYNNSEKNSEKTASPALQGDFSFRKREIFEELILLFQTLQNSIHLK